jgi:hypothetical protein
MMLENAQVTGIVIGPDGEPYVQVVVKPEQVGLRAVHVDTLCACGNGNPNGPHRIHEAGTPCGAPGTLQVADSGLPPSTCQCVAPVPVKAYKLEPAAQQSLIAPGTPEALAAAKSHPLLGPNGRIH